MATPFEWLTWTTYSVRQRGQCASLARELSLSPSTLHRDVQRLEDAELITVTQVGRSRILHPNAAHPLARPLTEILEYIYGPPTVITEEFSAIPGITRLAIFGSWAARHAGISGHVPRDIDVLVVGDADRGQKEQRSTAGKNVNTYEFSDDVYAAEAEMKDAAPIAGAPPAKKKAVTKDFLRKK